MNGPVYAKTVLHTSGGEIHRIPFQVSNTADVFFVGKTEEVPVSSGSSSSETPSQESSTPASNGTGSIPSSSSESSSSETPSQESSTPTGNGAGTLSSETASTGSDSPSATVETAHKLPRTGTDIVPVLVSVAGGSAVMLYGVLELLRSRGRKKHE